MATGRSNKLVAQTGEYLVAAELSRRGLIATTFTGNVPHYDISASDEEGHHVSVQVKASRLLARENHARYAGLLLYLYESASQGRIDSLFLTGRLSESF